MSFSHRSTRVWAAAIIVAAGWTVAGCTLLGGTARPQPQPPRATAPPVAAPLAPITVTPLTTKPPPAAAPIAGDKVPVALLLPLSGPSAALGRAMLDAAQMALFEIPDNRVALLVRDSGGTGPKAVAAAQSAVSAGARLIIGPLLSPEIEAVKPLMQGTGIAVIAFSTAAQLAGNGTWLLGFDPRQEIERVVAYAHAHGRDRFAALAPQGAYGDIAVAALRDATQLAGASIGRIARYDPAAPSYNESVESFAAGGADFDAALLPEGGARLKTLAPLLPYYGVDPDQVKLLGTGLWADSTIGTGARTRGRLVRRAAAAAAHRFRKAVQRALQDHAAASRDARL